MTPHAFAAAVLAAFSFTLASAPAQADDNGSWLTRLGWQSVNGSGRVQTETRAVTGFEAIALGGSMTLVLRQGTREGLALQADDNILPLIETRVVDRGGVATLEIGTKKGARYNSRNPVVATVDLITLRALAISGSGDVSSEALKTKALRISVSGSGNIRLHQLAADELSAQVSGSGDLNFTGRAATLNLAISGSGEVDAQALEADDVTLNVAGNGDARINARKTLAVSIAGNGNVSYTGDASVKSSIAGHGSVKKQ